jgi:hypothetical protein
MDVREGLRRPDQQVPDSGVPRRNQGLAKCLYRQEAKEEEHAQALDITNRRGHQGIRLEVRSVHARAGVRQHRPKQEESGRAGHDRTSQLQVSDRQSKANAWANLMRHGYAQVVNELVWRVI